MNKDKAMEPLDSERLTELVCGQRWASLGTLDSEKPFVSWVAYAVDPEGQGLLLHLSRLARHTQNLLKASRVSMAVSEADKGEADPQQLARISLQGDVSVIERDNVQYPQCRDHYLARLPDSEMLFGFKDFILFRFVPCSAHYVQGFASTHRLTQAQLFNVFKRYLTD